MRSHGPAWGQTGRLSLPTRVDGTVSLRWESPYVDVITELCDLEEVFELKLSPSSAASAMVLLGSNGAAVALGALPNEDRAEGRLTCQ